jgi:hypothetical protein
VSLQFNKQHHPWSVQLVN